MRNKISKLFLALPLVFSSMVMTSCGNTKPIGFETKLNGGNDKVEDSLYVKIETSTKVSPKVTASALEFI